MLCNQRQHKQCSVYGKAHSKYIKSVARLRKIACELSENKKKYYTFFFDIITCLYGMINNNLTL